MYTIKQRDGDGYMYFILVFIYHFTNRATKDSDGRNKGVTNKSKLTEHGVNKTQAADAHV